MNDRIREQLLGYLLGALEDGEHADIERQLARDPELRRELATLGEVLRPLRLDHPGSVEPPPDLSERTCSLVDAFEESEFVVLPAARFSTGRHSAGRSRGHLSAADYVVTAGILLASVLLFFPAIFNSRQLARLTHCSENLRVIGMALAGHCESFGGGSFFPRVPMSGNRAFAGIYGPMLRDEGFVWDAKSLICPSSSLADSRVDFRIPSLAEIDTASGSQLDVIRNTAGGSYGYNLGFFRLGQYSGPRNTGRARFALMADAPRVAPAGYPSDSHGNRGQNFLFEDGHVEFVQCSEAVCLDDPFRSHRGLVEPGVDKNDSVIAPSSAPPIPIAAFGRPVGPPLRGGH